MVVRRDQLVEHQKKLKKEMREEFEENIEMFGLMDLEKLSKYEKLKSLVEFWRDCLGENDTYYDYCYAKRSGDETLCEQLRDGAEDIHEIYRDFGDFYEGSGQVSFDTWFQPRAHLFGLQEIKLVVPDGSVPLSIDDQNHILDKTYDFLYKKAKYALNLPPKEEVVFSLYRLWQARIINEMLCQVDENGEKYYTKYGLAKQLTMNLWLQKYLGFAWNVDTAISGNYVSIVDRANKFYLQCIKSTLVKVFPYANFKKPRRK